MLRDDLFHQDPRPTDSSGALSSGSGRGAHSVVTSAGDKDMLDCSRNSVRWVSRIHRGSGDSYYPTEDQPRKYKIIEKCSLSGSGWAPVLASYFQGAFAPF